MREVVFLKKNKKKWKQMEVMLSKYKVTAPDKLADLYIELMDDLAYAQTNYNDSNTTIYLNDLAVDIYQAIYENKKERTNRLYNFWMYEFCLLYTSPSPRD